MNIFIPTIGTVLELTQDWAVEVYHEYRNAAFLDSCGKINSDTHFYGPDRGQPKSYHIVLPAGTRLKVDRIYLKKGAGNYDSVTFWCNSHIKAKRGSGQIKGRFWAKLKDVNQLVADVLEVPEHAVAAR